jgi:hypothetical protein
MDYPPQQYMPDGSTHAPLVMTAQEVIELLRLDMIDTKHPDQSLERLRAQGLKSIRLGKACRFYLGDVLEFLDERSRV